MTDNTNFFAFEFDDKKARFWIKLAYFFKLMCRMGGVGGLPLRVTLLINQTK
jgi:hypothetical protein